MTVLKSVKHKYGGAVAVQSQQGISRRLLVVLAVAIIMATVAGLWALIQTNAPQLQAYPPTPIMQPVELGVDHCKVLTQEVHYLVWRMSAQIVLYGDEIDEPYYQPMWYMVQASPLCNVDLTILQPAGGFFLDGVTLDMSPPLNYDKFVEWKQKLANHTTTPEYFSGGK